MTDSVISLAVLVGVVVLFMTNRFPVEVVAIGSALVLYASGVIELTDALAGFGDPTVVLIAALFVVSEGLDATGVTTWVGDGLLRRAGGSDRKLLVFMMLLVAGFTALINLNGSVAALLPMVLVLAVQRGMAPSRLLMPLVFAGSAGSLLLLTGSPVNVIISDAAAAAGVDEIAFAEFALVGIPLVIGTMALMLLLSGRLLPDRTGEATERDLTTLAGSLVEQYALHRVVHLRVAEKSPLVNHTRLPWELEHRTDMRVIMILDGTTQQAVSDGEFVPGDRLSVIGDPGSIEHFRTAQGLELLAVRDQQQVTDALINRDVGVAEVVVPPRSRFLGETVRPGQVLRGGSLVVLAVHRRGDGDHADEGARLKPGDVLLLEGSWDALDRILEDADVLLVDSPELVRRRAVPLGRRSKRAIGVLVAMVALLASGAIPAVVAALLAAGAMIVLRVLTVQQAYRRISWTTVLLVAGIIPLSTAIQRSGAGEQIADALIGAVGEAGPIALLIALFLLTAVFGQLISNTATALIVIPIAVSAAAQLDISPKPVLMCVLVAAAASFLTPVATPANMMVMGPAGYRFGDYWRLGLPLMGLFFLVGVGLVPLIWPL
ncbi:MAG: SLC13 family permease [Nitriliruptor sp.]|nr:MAG: SLC13 family permease [Nitriliruptor sp.]